MKKLIFLLLLVLLAALGLVYYKKWRKDFLHKKVPELVFLESDSLYRITYDTIDIDEVDGEIMIKNLQLIPDSTYKKPTDSTLPRNLLRVTVPEVYITGVETDAAMLDKVIIASKVKLTSPVVTMYNNRYGAKNDNNRNDTAATTDKIYKVLLRGLQKIKVDTILIADADYHICNWPRGDTVFSGSHINAKLNNINISDSTSADTSRILFAENATLDVKKVIIRRKNRFYNYVFTDIKLLSAERSFAVEKLQVVPLMGEAAFMRAFKWQTDRLDFDLYNLLFKQVNVQEILNGNLIANQLTIKKASFKIFRDKSYPEQKEKKIGHYPHQDLLKIPIDVALKKIIIQSGYIEYKEKNPQTGSSGLVFFDNVSASLLNVSNRNNNGILTVNFNSRFLGKAPLTATLQFYMNNRNGKFTAHGSMKTTDATVLNTLSKPMALIEINSGMINSLDFNLICDDYKARGIIRLLYNDLKIKILKQEETGSLQDYKPKKVLSLLANMTIVDGNPQKNNPVRIVTVNHQRNIYRSMFNLIWKAIFEGAQKTVGIDGKLKSKQ